MGSVNKVILIGNLGGDPELKYTPGNVAVCNLSVATNEVRKDKASGGKVQKTEWHHVTVFNETAEACGQYVKKGSTIYVEGRLQTRKWTDKDGRERATTEVVADRVVFLDGGKRETVRAPEPPPVQEDVPF